MPKYNNNDIEEYFQSLSISMPLQKRIWHLIDQYKLIMGRDPEYLLLENILSPDGIINHTNLACFEAKTYVDIAIPEVNSEISLVSTAGLRAFAFVKVENYEFGKPRENSILQVKIKLGDNTTFSLSAVGQNCAEVMNVSRAYIIPNLLT